MADRQRLVIGNLAQYGMVEEVDALDLPPNAFQLLKNIAFYKGRLGAAGRWGALSSATPIFNGTTYACCGLWELYNSGVLKVKAGDFAEYENAAGTMYEIPCWLGLYASVVETTGVCTGTALDGNWSTATFPRAPNKWLTKNDKVFLSSLATAEFAENFTDLTTAYAIAVTGITTAPTAGATYVVHGTVTPVYTVISTGLTGSAPNIQGTIYINGASAPAASSHMELTGGTGENPLTYTYTAANNVVRLNTYTEWADSSNNILQSNSITTYHDTAYNTSAVNDGQAYNTGAIASVANQFFTIRKIKLLGEGARAALIVRDNTTHRGYALEVLQETPEASTCYTFYVRRSNWTEMPVVGNHYTHWTGSVTYTYEVIGCTTQPSSSGDVLVIYTTGDGDPTLPVSSPYPVSIRRAEDDTGGGGQYWYYSYTKGAPVTVSLRLWDGYFDSTDTAMGDNATIVWQKTRLVDWGYSAYNATYHEDLWMWWRGNFLTFGYGPNAMGCVTISATPATPRVGFALKYAYIGAKSGTYSCIYSYAITKTGPYAISSFADATSVTISSPPADGTYLIWASKYASRQKIVPASDYLLFVTDNTSSANFPATIWRGGMTEEVPLTNPTYHYNYAYSANDSAIFKGRVFLAGANRMIHKYTTANGCYEWTLGLNTPTLVKWSSPYYPTVWEDQYPQGTTADQYYGAGHLDFAETNGAVNAIGQLRDVLVVYKSDAIAMLSPTGIALDPFSVDYMAWQVGAGDPRTVAVTPEVHLFPTPDAIWQVQIGEVTKTGARYSVGAYGKVWVLPGENTMFAQAYYFGDISNLCVAYNYQSNAVYYAELKNLVDVVEQKNAVFAITAAGLYLYQTRETNSVPTSYVCASPVPMTASALTAVLSMNDLLNSKTIYNVDVFTRCRSIGAAPTSASMDIRVVCDNTAEADYTTVSGEIVGKEQPGFALVANPVNETNLWRFRYNKILTGLTFQVDLRLNTSYLTHEIVRIEVDYEPHGESKNNPAK